MRDLVDAMVQERLFDVAQRAEVDPAAAVAGVDCADGEHWRMLSLDGGWLSLRCRRTVALQRWRLARGPVWFTATGSTPRPVEPAELLRLLISERDEPALPGADGVLADLATAVEHASITLDAQATRGDTRVISGELLAGERLATTRGRPFHPTARAVSGWNADTLAEYGPMRADPLALDWVAVRREHLRHGGDPASHRLHELLLDHTDRRRLARELRRAGLSEAEFQPIPVHPWQFRHALPKAFAAEFAAGDVVALARGLGSVRPTASLRTLASEADPRCQVKLPLSVATLGATRLLPARYLDNGDRAQRIMAELVERDPVLHRWVRLAREDGWAGWRHSAGGDEFADRPGLLAAQIRRLPAELTDSAAVVLPMGALAADEWDTLGPALGVERPAGAKALELFGRIADAFCLMCLSFLRYGVLPEVHGQNVLVVLRDGCPERFILRDHDTMRVFAAWSAAEGVPDPGYRIKPGARQSLLLPSAEALLGYLQTLGFQVNLHGIADALARWSTVDESAFWSRLRDSVAAALRELPLRLPVAELIATTVLRSPTWPSREILGPLLRNGNSTGVSMPAEMGTVPNPLLPAAPAEAHSARAHAEQAANRRLLNSYLRETGNHDPRGAADGSACQIRLPTSGLVLTGTMTHFSALGLHVYGERFTVTDPVGADSHAVEHAELVDMVLAEVAALGDAQARPLGPRSAADHTASGKPAACGPESAARRRELAGQIENSVERTARYLAQPPPGSPAADDHHRLTRHAEQSVLLGHPLHPTPKSAEGFSAGDITAYAPELGAAFRLHYVAVAPELLVERRVAPGRWLPEEVAEAAADRLRGSGREHRLLPLHPWQAEYALRHDSARRLVADGALIPLGALGPPVYATSSVRTVCDPGFPTAWKLPLHVRITNFVRTNPIEHLRRATDASALLASVRADPAWPSHFEVLIETGSHTFGDPALAAEFSVLYRENPFAQRAEAPLVLAGLLDDRPGHEPGIIRALRQAIGVASGPLPLPEVSRWLREYLSISVLALLEVFARHGVSLEAHVQNSLVCLDNGWPVRFVVRDMEGVSVSRDRAPRQIEHDSPVLYDDAQAWERLQYYAITNHLGHLLQVLAHFGCLDERRLWAVVTEELRGAPRNRHIDDLLASRTLPAKANLLSRFLGRGERPLHVRVPNPIREDHP